MNFPDQQGADCDQQDADGGLGQSSKNHQRIPERRCLEESSIVESHPGQCVDKEEEFPVVDASQLTRKTFLPIGTHKNLESGPAASISSGLAKRIERDSSGIWFHKYLETLLFTFKQVKIGHSRNERIGTEPT